jgi:small-conductance mechanosensitive channel
MAKKMIREGDNIEIEGVKGTIFKISTISTTLISEDNKYVSVPNSKFFFQSFKKEKEQNEHFSVHLVFELSFFMQNPEQLLQLAKEAVLSSLYVDLGQKYEVTIKSIEKDKIMIQFKLFVFHGKYSEQIKSDLLLRINEHVKLEKNGNY